MQAIMPIVARHGYLVVFLVLFVEGMGVPGVPFELVFLASGMLAARGQLALTWCVAAGTAGTVLGNLAGYGLGVVGRDYLRGPRAPAFLRLTPDRLAAVQRWFAAYGPVAVFLARWFGPIRTPVILGSGIAGMAFRPYALYSLLGAALWNTAWQLATFRLGQVAVRIWSASRWLLAGGLAAGIVAAAWAMGRRPRPARAGRN